VSSEARLRVVEPGVARLEWPSGERVLRSLPLGQEGAPLRADPFVPIAFVDALRHGRRLRIEDPVSPRLLASLPAAARVMRGWFGHWPETQTVAAGRPVPPPQAAGRGVGCFFSGGIDSFHTLLRHRDEVTALIVIQGFDVRLDDAALRERTSREAREVGAALGLDVFEVESNARELWVRAWARYFGGVLAGAAHGLAHRLRKVFVPASDYGEPILPNGSHPDLDPLWSTEAMEIVHDGCEVPRLEKTRIVAADALALAHLRCCHESWGEGAFNCGRCEKCLRTMTGLRLCGALGRATTFERPFDPWYVARLPALDGHVRKFAEENLAAAVAQGDRELAQALREALSGVHRRPWRRLLGAIRRRVAPRL
jgi:hypothetical protein